MPKYPFRKFFHVREICFSHFPITSAKMSSGKGPVLMCSGTVSLISGERSSTIFLERPWEGAVFNGQRRMESFLLIPSLLFLGSRSVSSGHRGVFAGTRRPVLCSRAVRLAQGKAPVTIRGMSLRRGLPRSPYRQSSLGPHLGPQSALMPRARSGGRAGFWAWGATPGSTETAGSHQMALGRLGLRE